MHVYFTLRKRGVGRCNLANEPFAGVEHMREARHGLTGSVGASHAVEQEIQLIAIATVPRNFCAPHGALAC